MSYNISSTGNLLGKLTSADMNSTVDQAIVINSSRYIIRNIVVSNASTSLTTAAGGLYTGAGKTGTTIVGLAQIYTALTGSTKWIDLSLAAGVTGDILTATTIFFSLTTPQGTAATADVYILGDSLI